MHTKIQVQASTLADHEQLARLAALPSHWAYLNGGAADEITKRKNVHAWQNMELLPRVLQPLDNLHTQIELLGRLYPHPVFVAPMAYQQLAHPDGELASALAAAAQGAGFVCSTQSSTLLEDVAAVYLPEYGRGPLWFQLYMLHDRGFTLELVKRAERAGYEAIVLTVDAPVSGVRDNERQHDFKLPEHIRAINLQGLAPQTLTPHAILKQAPTWKDVAWLAAHTRLPVLLKGITHPADAGLAIEHGAKGVIVSNHGGRTLDTMPATASVLQSVVQTVAGRVPVLVDGGIRRGTDVLKAIALGADAVLVGRPVLHGLINAGAPGVAHVLRLLKDELEIAMALCGCTSPDQINTRLIHIPAVASTGT